MTLSPTFVFHRGDKATAATMFLRWRTPKMSPSLLDVSLYYSIRCVDPPQSGYYVGEYRFAMVMVYNNQRRCASRSAGPPRPKPGETMALVKDE